MDSRDRQIMERRFDGHVASCEICGSNKPCADANSMRKELGREKKNRRWVLALLLLLSTLAGLAYYALY